MGRDVQPWDSRHDNSCEVRRVAAQRTASLKGPKKNNMRRVGPSRLRKGYRGAGCWVLGAAQPSTVLAIEFAVLLRLPANQRARPPSCLRC